jgi:hypothetical protein
MKDIEVYKEAGQDFSNDIETPASTQLDYIDNDNNNRVRDKAAALKSLNEFIGMINAKHKQNRQSNNRGANT